MKVRLFFQCGRCGSTSFRSSSARGFKDSLLGHLGVHAQRCHMCRRRFYLFKPYSLRPFLLALDAPPQDGRDLNSGVAEQVADASDA
jgi:hypothetical protein